MTLFSSFKSEREFINISDMLWCVTSLARVFKRNKRRFDRRLFWGVVGLIIDWVLSFATAWPTPWTWRSSRITSQWVRMIRRFSCSMTFHVICWMDRRRFSLPRSTTFLSKSVMGRLSQCHTLIYSHQTLRLTPHSSVVGFACASRILTWRSIWRWHVLFQTNRRALLHWTDKWARNNSLIVIVARCPSRLKGICYVWAGDDLMLRVWLG